MQGEPKKLHGGQQAADFVPGMLTWEAPQGFCRRDNASLSERLRGMSLQVFEVEVEGVGLGS